MHLQKRQQQFNMELWKNEFRKISFAFEGHDALLILPNDEVKTDRLMLKTEYFGAFPELEIALLRRGYHLAYLKNRTRLGTDIDTDAKARFVHYLHEHYGTREKCVPIGMSCGGMQAVHFAAKYPELVSVMYLDAPVMNLFSWPFGFGACPVNTGEAERKEVLNALGLTLSEFISFREHPMDRIPTLLTNKTPAVLVYGDGDTVVPHKENAILLENAYKEKGLPLFVCCKEGCDHHPHGPSEQDFEAVISFIEKWDTL